MATGPLERIEHSLSEVRDALLGTLGGRAGVVQDVRELKAQGEKVAQDLKAQGERITTLEAVPGRRALDLWERLGLLAAGVALTAASQLLLRFVGTPPAAPPAQHGAPNR